MIGRKNTGLKQRSLWSAERRGDRWKSNASHQAVSTLSSRGLGSRVLKAKGSDVSEQILDVAVIGAGPAGLVLAEAATGGSALNFLADVNSVDDVADAYERALDTGKLEHYVPRSDGFTGRLAAVQLSLIPKLLPHLNKLGERGRKKYLASPEPNWNHGVSELDERESK